MFVQGEQDLDRAKGGLGIGLTFVRRLVSLHGGTVVASSDGEGHGSTFTVRLRRIPAAHRPTGLSARPNRVDPRRVLLIEDDRDAREMIRLMLELAGHAVYNAPDGIRGLELMKAERPDVAIIDVGLPGLDGYQVARRIREHLNGRAMLLLALTGYGRPRDYQHSTEAGFDYHLVKPVDLDTLACLLQTGMLPVEAS
jgi:CheY-like chemotaxis protein